MYGGCYYSALLHTDGVDDPLNLTDDMDLPKVAMRQERMPSSLFPMEGKSCAGATINAEHLPDGCVRTSLVVYDAGSTFPPASLQPFSQMALESASLGPRGPKRASSARKRGFGSSTPLLVASGANDDGVPAGSHHKNGRVQADRGHLSLAETDVRIDREEWPELWASLSAGWPDTAATPYPLVYGDSVGWEAAARLEPELFLHHLRRFVFPDELLASLADIVLVQWTALWRQECLYFELLTFRQRVTDELSIGWLDQWIARTQQRISPSKLAP